MAGYTVHTGHGTTVGFGTTTFTSEILSITFPDVSRESINVSHMGTSATTSGGFGSEEFIMAALVDGGSMDLELHHDPDKVPPVDLAIEEITVTWPKATGDSTAATWVFQGGATGYSPSAPHDDKMTGSLSVKISGKVVITAAA